MPLGAAHGATLIAAALWAGIDAALLVPATATTFNTQNLRGQTLLFRCLETGFVTTAPALTRYQQGRGIDPSRRELIGNRPANWIREAPTTVCEHCGMAIKGIPGGCGSTNSPSGARRRRECPDAQPSLDAGALGSLRPCRWGQVLATHHGVSQEPGRHPNQDRTLQAVAGTDLAEGSAGGVMGK